LATTRLTESVRLHDWAECEIVRTGFGAFTLENEAEETPVDHRKLVARALVEEVRGTLNMLFLQVAV
jgi:hypothetical protein